MHNHSGTDHDYRGADQNMSDRERMMQSAWAAQLAANGRVTAQPFATRYIHHESGAEVVAWDLRVRTIDNLGCKVRRVTRRWFMKYLELPQVGSGDGAGLDAGATGRVDRALG